MKKRFAFIMLAAIALAGCQKKELDLPVAESLPYVGTTESFDADTKTTLEDGRVLWRRGDQVSIFAGRTLNERYQVTDESDGLTTAAFNAVSTPGFVSSVAISNNVAYYPYAERNVLGQRGNVYELSTTLPAVQQYAEDSFGPGAFPMTSVTSSTSDYNLKFKNVLGGVKLQLKGDATIASISITGNAGEVLCGAAKVSVEAGGVPSIELTDATATTVTLDCGAGVQLSSTEATSFIIALPPMTMTSGFTVTVTDTDGMTLEISTDKSQTITRSSILKMPAKEYDFSSSTGKPSKELCFTAELAGSTVALNKDGEPYDVPQEYCTDGEHWYPYTFGTTITLANVGDKVYFRKMTDGVSEGFSKGYDSNERTDNYYQFAMSGRLVASGNVMSLIDRACQSTTIPNDWCFYRLFVFCESLTQAPELPATTLADYCYDQMFYGCKSLTQAPELPATTLAEYCYSDMFRGCTALTQAPELPATTLADGCYWGMFYSCTALTEAPELPATTLAEYCYSGMFRGCTALTQAPELPATTLADYCYEVMFSGCTALTQAPELPATTLAEGCYDSMFRICTSLTQAPELPVMTLAQSCYSSMFLGCTSLTQAPELPATTLAAYCYYHMFHGCTSLNEVRCYATDISASSATSSWLYNVSSTGTFYADPSTNWSRGTSGIPVGWTVKSLDGTSSHPSRELCFTAEKAGSTVKLNKVGNPYDVSQEYCADGEHWYPYTFGTAITLANVGDKVYFRKMTDGVAEGFSKGYDYNEWTDNRYHFTMSGRLAASGNVMTLVDRTCQSTTTPNDNCFYRLFYGCTSLTQAPELPATTLAKGCYDGMFYGCTSLTQAPKLPAKKLVKECYYNMFYGCTSLTQAPELPATTLAIDCYSSMFSDCTALTQAPELPATTLALSCYYCMFSGCTALTKAPELPATTLADLCYQSMFQGCTSLTQAPELPATTLADYCYCDMFWYCTSLAQAPELPATTLAGYCYQFMFAGCTSLTQAPEFPATKLAVGCYYGMFYNCTSLTQAPELPATTLAKGCYDGMFRSCTALTQAPELPATTLAERCYSGMFSGCTALTQAPKLPAKKLVKECYYNMFYGCTSLNEVRCYATDISASDATTAWLSGVSSTGTFYAYTSTNWSRGDSGIPYGWTVKALTSATGQPTRELCFTAEQAGSTVALNKEGEPYDVPQEYCTDGENWYPYTFGTAITLANVGDKVYFRKRTDGAGGFTKGYKNSYQFTMSGRLAASGSVMSLVDRTCQSTRILNESCFYSLFYGCTSLTRAPELPATTLARGCYDDMFYGCTSLTQAPELPATTLAYSCYGSMFYDCTALTQAPELPATTLADYCYYSMFYGCTSLSQAPELHATTLANNCYGHMFWGCASLSQAPELPATTLASMCYSCMFRGCTALSQAPQLPATTLAERCYSDMFYGCRSLTKAPELPAATLVTYCYNDMFHGCTSLKEVRCYATDISAYNATTDWLYNVSSTGTFYADPSANWSRSTSGIPVGWTVKRLSE